MKPAILLALLIATAAQAAEPNPVHVRAMGKGYMAIGCLDKRDTDRVIRLVEVADIDALVYLRTTGRCFGFYAYQAEEIAAGLTPPIAFEETTEGDYGCVRPQGRPDCYWLRRDQYAPTDKRS